ncbi:MAG TPA: SDR family oxidoreductase [Polyangiales bacterium]|nr:SDR family oxidoreductase [Polyangiales bacterium]
MAANDPREEGHKPPFPKQAQDNPASEREMNPRPDYGYDSYRGHERLKDRVALITGGDSGIGRAVAVAFAREGADVAIVYAHSDQDADETLRAVAGAGRKGLKLKADIGKDDECRRIVREVVRDFGRIDVLVNNAAVQGKSVDKFEELTAERVEHTFRTNIIAMFNLTREALPHMKAGANVINTASIQAYKPTPNILDYAVTKGAIVTFTKGLSESLLERGIRVNCVAPGPVWTPLVVQSFSPEENAKFGQSSTLGRPAQPAELAPAYVFLASDEASYVSGEILGVTGGKPLG